MKALSINSQFNFLNKTNVYRACSSTSPFFIPISCLKHHKHPSQSSLPSNLKTNIVPKQTALKGTRNSHNANKKLILKINPKCQNHSEEELSSQFSKDGTCRYFIIGAVSVGVILYVMGVVDEQKAWALGPEGPLMEEFWDNVRRYGLYALTVSTGALYTIFLPIFELLKNPISALLVLIIIGGGIFIVSQVVSAMVGVTDFTYDYSY